MISWLSPHEGRLLRGFGRGAIGLILSGLHRAIQTGRGAERRLARRAIRLFLWAGIVVASPVLVRAEHAITRDRERANDQHADEQDHSRNEDRHDFGHGLIANYRPAGEARVVDDRHRNAPPRE